MQQFVFILDWEDRKLGNYLFSETRFEEIIENTCKETEVHKLSPVFCFLK